MRMDFSNSLGHAERVSIQESKQILKASVSH